MKLTEDDAVEIIIRVWKDERRADIARKFSITEAYIARIIHGQAHAKALPRAIAYWRKYHPDARRLLPKRDRYGAPRPARRFPASRNGRYWY